MIYCNYPLYSPGVQGGLRYCGKENLYPLILTSLFLRDDWHARCEFLFFLPLS